MSEHPFEVAARLRFVAKFPLKDPLSFPFTKLLPRKDGTWYPPVFKRNKYEVKEAGSPGGAAVVEGKALSPAVLAVEPPLDCFPWKATDVDMEHVAAENTADAKTGELQVHGVFHLTNVFEDLSVDTEVRLSENQA